MGLQGKVSSNFLKIFYQPKTTINCVNLSSTRELNSRNIVKGKKLAKERCGAVYERTLLNYPCKVVIKILQARADKNLEIA
jgi:hypothetical protein